ncbi:MAG TPA: orotate phosphoribosyltransferase [Xanthobacteraceae bacterium]|nr:orotate phosphoribosyltransferase [Xanthobacteraceae bacterium]
MEPLRFPGNKGTSRSRALALIKERSFVRGRITLASGKESDFYLDLKPSMLHPEGAGLIAELILEKLSGVEADYVGGVAVGAIPLISPVIVQSFARGRGIAGFFVRKDVKDHGTRRKIDGLGPGEMLTGKKVVILEDVTTTGASAMIAVQAAKDAGADVAMVLSVVDRQDGAAEFFRDQGIQFESVFTASEFLTSN